LLLQQTSFQRHMTVASAKKQSDEAFDPDLAEYTFSCWLKCASPKCAENVAVIGTGHQEPTWDEEHGMDWEECFIPKFAWRMPPIFSIPEGCPTRVAEQLHASFRLAWSDSSAAASRLRVATERLLDEVGVPTRKRTTKGVATLTLHQRIELLAGKRPNEAKNLMAIKWLGNTGSHENAVDFDDLLAGYEIMEPSLDAILGERSKRAAKLAKLLTKKHARRRRKK
jgi:uncharacterized protein DUF4145